VGDGILVEEVFDHLAEGSIALSAWGYTLPVVLLEKRKGKRENNNLVAREQDQRNLWSENGRKLAGVHRLLKLHKKEKGNVEAAS